MKNKKHTKRFLAIVLMGLFLFSCNKDTLEPPCCVNIDITFALRIKNSAGEDLLDTSVLGHFRHSNISYYSFINDKLTILGLGKTMVFYPEPNAEIFDYRIFISELGGKIKNAPYPIYESFLKLSPSEIDTIQVETLETKNSQSLRKVWYNKKLIWGVDQDNNLPVTIVK